MIYIDNTMPIEYTIHKGKLVLLKRPDLHYYTQNFTQTWWNQYTGKFAQKAAGGRHLCQFQNWRKNAIYGKIVEAKRPL